VDSEPDRPAAARNDERWSWLSHRSDPSEFRTPIVRQ
jgi:hypothetical protein